MQAAVNIQNRDTHTVNYSFLVDGEDLKERFGVLSVTIAKEFNRIPSANIILNYDPNQNYQENGRDQQDRLINKLEPGKPVEITAGYQSASDTIFQGVIVKKSLKLLNGKLPIIELECKDIALKATLYKKSKYYYQQKDSDIIRQILQNYEGIEIGTIDNTSFEHRELVQFYCTDWDFIVSRAEANGLYVMVNDGTISAQKINREQQEHCRVIYGGELIEFETQIDPRSHLPAVSVRNWNYVDQALEEQTSPGRAAIMPSNDEFVSFNYSAAFYNQSPYVIYHGGDFSEEELAKWAETKYEKSIFSSNRGRLRLRGVASILPNMMVRVEAVGSEFDGLYFVSGVTHQIYGGMWLTDLQLGLSTKWFSETALTDKGDFPILYPGIQGLQTGVVTRVEGDELSGDHRIQVRMPYIALQTDAVTSSQAEGIWARLGTLYAGDNRGFVFRPEVDDEVILGFINNDPNNAVILGALHSNKYPSPIPAVASNKEKGFHSKSGMKIILDDEAKSIKITTPQGFAVNISEQDGKLELKDKNDNIISLSSSGITLDSKSNISISASGNIKIQGTRIDLN